MPVTAECRSAHARNKCAAPRLVSFACRPPNRASNCAEKWSPASTLLNTCPPAGLNGEVPDHSNLLREQASPFRSRSPVQALLDGPVAPGGSPVSPFARATAHETCPCVEQRALGIKIGRPRVRASARHIELAVDMPEVKHVTRDFLGDAHGAITDEIAGESGTFHVSVYCSGMSVPTPRASLASDANHPIKYLLPLQSLGAVAPLAFAKSNGGTSWSSGHPNSSSERHVPEIGSQWRRSRARQNRVLRIR
jgi:hypothetical protein